MSRLGVFKTFLCFTLTITVSWALPTEVEGENCKLLDHLDYGFKGAHLINVQCGDNDIGLQLFEAENFAQTTVFGKDGQQLLQVTYDQTGDEHDMSINIEGVEFDVKDDDSKEEAAKFKALLDNPAFRYFPEAVRLIHDDLKLMGWKSSSVMILYRLGVFSEHYKTVVLNKRWPWEDKVDKDTYKYHGSNPSKKCKKNGWLDKDMDHLIGTQCRGVCGPTCKSCWQSICGDCCMHKNCQIHDDLCTEYWKPDCLSGRGVLWDKPMSKLKGC